MRSMWLAMQFLCDSLAAAQPADWLSHCKGCTARPLQPCPVAVLPILRLLLLLLPPPLPT